jgi:bifunctional non-homologous end joining protein LigD
MRTIESITIGGKKLALSNLNKPLYPDGFTKGQVIDYYRAIAPVMLPHLKGRAATLKRYPNGSDKPFFFEKNCPSHRPTWVKTTENVGSTGTVNHCVISNEAALAWVANLAALEIHVPMAIATQPDRPSAMVFDLDPGPGNTILDCVRLAIRLRDMLADLDLQSMAKTSGGKGLHLYVPLNNPKITSEQSKIFAHAIASILARQSPDIVTVDMSKAVRGGRIFIDWSQNDRHKTTVCVYSLRAQPHPTVSTPVQWKELEMAVKKGDASKLVFTASDVLKRVEKFGDLFEAAISLRQKLPPTAE